RYVRKARKNHKVRLALLSLVNLIAKLAKLPLNKASNHQTINNREHSLVLLSHKAKLTVNVVMIQMVPHSCRAKITLPDLILMVPLTLGYKVKQTGLCNTA